MNKSWFRLAALGCLGWVTVNVAAWAGNLAPHFQAFGPAAVEHSHVASSPVWTGGGVLCCAGVVALTIALAMVPVVPLHRPSWPAGGNNGKNGHDGNHGNGNGNGHGTDKSNGVQDDASFSLEEVFNSASDLIYAHDLSGRFTLINPAGLEFLGYTAIDSKELTIEKVVAPEHHAMVRHLMETALNSGQSVLFEAVLLNRNGGRRAMEISSKVIRKAGQPVGMFAIARDITARNSTAVVASDSSDLLETLLEYTPECIYFKDRESRFVHFSRAFVEHFNVSDPGQVKGKTDFDFFSPEHACPAYDDEQEIIRTGNSVIGKVEKETYADGRVRWSKTNKMPWRDKNGNTIGTFGVSTDITALKEVEDKLAHERELLRTLLDNIPECIYFKDLQSRFVAVSKSKAQKAFKHSPDLRTRLFKRQSDNPPASTSDTEQLIGLTDFDTFTEDHARPAYEDEQRIIRTGEPIINKLEKETNQDGSVTWALTTKMPWRDKSGKTIGTFGISNDITALKQAESELEATHKRLVHASRLAGMAEVATDVLHNVGNVLNSINISCSLVIDRVQDSSYSNLAKIPQMLRSNTGHLDDFLTKDDKGKHIPDFLEALAQTFEDQRKFLLHELNQLRNYIDHIKQVVTMQQNYAKVAGVQETIEVNQLVDDALHINADALHRHSVEYRKDFEPVPPILVDKHKVLQILVNLIRNGKYALSESSRRDKLMTLRIRRSGEDRVQIQVVDNGVGIPAENLTRIFSHGFTTRRDGHGFGLHSGALAARDLGGSLTAHSDGQDKGAMFTLELPLKRNAPAK